MKKRLDTSDTTILAPKTHMLHMQEIEGALHNIASSGRSQTVSLLQACRDFLMVMFSIKTVLIMSASPALTDEIKTIKAE